MGSRDSDVFEATLSSDPRLTDPMAETAVERPASASRPAAPPARGLDRGASLGRYVILGLLGEGAMGEVYAAYDPELDRRIALKVLHREERASDEGRELARGRLVKEAQAMARLSHPNVIHVFDVGTVDDDIYVAMELIDGRSLATWLETPREWPEILDVFRQAALGLAHAHEAGVVHRDFKPENVLVGKDGRARVIDFGIARQVVSPDELLDRPSNPDLASPPERSAGSSPGASALAELVKTMAGVLIGTPAYMSPEQLLGKPAGAQSDQFSFCVALYRALYGRKPFDGEGLVQLMERVTAGDLIPPPTDSRVPRWLARAVVRGLSTDPADRHPHMRALAAQLVPPRRRRWRRWAALAAVTAAATAVLLWTRDPVAPDAEPCRGLSAHFDGVWDASRRRTIREAFAASGLEYADDARARVEAALDVRRDDWLGTRREACEATWVRGEQSESVLELRMACLDRHLREFEAAVRVLSEADSSVVQNAMQVVADLPRVSACDDLDRLRAEAAREPPPELREPIAEARRRLTRAHLLTEAGHYGQALEIAEAALEDLERLAHRPALAAAHMERARARVGLGDPRGARDDLFDAVRLSRDDLQGSTEANAWVELVFVTGVRLGEVREASRWARFADEAVERAGGDPLLDGRLAYHQGLIQAQLEEHEAALRAYDRALERYRVGLDEAHHRVAAVHAARASLLSMMGRAEEAIAAHRSAIAATEASLGAHHPQAAVLLNNLGNALRRAGRIDEARRHYRRSLALKRRALGPDHVSVAVTLVNLGILERRAGHHALASRRFARAREIRARRLGEAHPLYASVIAYQAALASDRGELDEALAMLTELRALRDAQGEPEPRARARAELALVLQRLGRGREARVEVERALELAGETRGATWVSVRVAAAFVEIEAGRPHRALAWLEGLEGVAAAAGHEPEEDALRHYLLGRALEESGRDAERGVRLVTDALDAFSAAGAPGRFGVELASSWLDRHA